MPSDRTTILIRRLSEGDADAAEELLPLVYDELHGLARRYMATQKPGHTLQPTALVHEAWLRVADRPEARDDRRHFVGIAAKAMRHVLVDHARAREALKRGGDRRRQPIDDALLVYEERAVDILALDEALTRLTEMDEQLASIVELRFFGGLTANETAEALDTSSRTVERGWTTARTWLRGALEDRPRDGGGPVDRAPDDDSAPGDEA